MRFSGILDRAALESAAGTALERHPLLRSRVEIVAGEKPRWIVTSDTVCEIDWQNGPLGEEFGPGTKFDLTCERGVRPQVKVDVRKIHADPSRSDRGSARRSAVSHAQTGAADSAGG